jgi:hypothetical protein
MAKNASDKLEARLKAVLEGLAEARWAGESPNAGAVLAHAVNLVPFDEKEAELLSGGIPRGHKGLTTATAKLVKAGWMVKGRSGWSITDDGMRALVAFPTVDSLSQALAEGTPIPDEVAVPSEPPVKKHTKKKAAAKAARLAAAEKEPTTVEAAELLAEAAEATVVEEASSNGVVQPDSVAIAGDFASHLGADADWEPALDEVQMALNPESKRWTRTVNLPAGTYTFKIAINRSWDENYGAFGHPNGANHELTHDGGPVTIEYDHRTKDIAFS